MKYKFAYVILVLSTVDCISTQQTIVHCNEINNQQIIPDSCKIDTLDIEGTIFPAHFYKTKKEIDSLFQRTPSKSEIIQAEYVFRTASKKYPCVYRRYKYYYRQYAGQENGNITIHGIIKNDNPCLLKRDWYHCWDCNYNFVEAIVNIKNGTCLIVRGIW